MIPEQDIEMLVVQVLDPDMRRRYDDVELGSETRGWLALQAFPLAAALRQRTKEVRRLETELAAARMGEGEAIAACG